MPKKLHIHKETVEPCVDPDLRRNWALEHDCCQCCGVSLTESLHKRYPPGLQVHHIVGGSRRYDYKWNFLMMCAVCHGQLHAGGYKSDDGEKLPELTIGHILWCKMVSGSGKHFRRRDIGKLLGRRCPDAVPLPKEFLAMRRRFGYTPEVEFFTAGSKIKRFGKDAKHVDDAL